MKRVRVPLSVDLGEGGEYFVFLLFVCFRPNRVFCIHMKTSPLSVKGCNFWPILGTYDQWAGYLACHTNYDTPPVLACRLLSSVVELMREYFVSEDGGPRLYDHLRGPVTLTPVANIWQWAGITCFIASGLSWPGFEHPTLRMRGKRYITNATAPVK